MTDTSLYTELLNRNIEFINNEGNIVLNFYSTDKQFIINSEHTNWFDNSIKHLSKKSKYTKLANVKNDYYNGDINDGELQNMMALLFKIKVKEGCIGSIIRKYIIMIIDNPEYNEDSSDYSKYLLVLYEIDRIGTMGIKLRPFDILKSNI
jgi:hypothetical protein